MKTPIPASLINRIAFASCMKCYENLIKTNDTYIKRVKEYPSYKGQVEYLKKQQDDTKRKCDELKKELITYQKTGKISDAIRLKLSPAYNALPAFDRLSSGTGLIGILETIDACKELLGKDPTHGEIANYRALKMQRTSRCCEQFIRLKNLGLIVTTKNGTYVTDLGHELMSHYTA